jgi:protein gp37
MATKIEWTGPRGETWNPWHGCDKIARECDHCYAAVFDSRGLSPQFAGVAVAGEWTGKIKQASEASWTAPLRWRQPVKVFTCSMSDFWHEDVPLP